MYLNGEEPKVDCQIVQICFSRPHGSFIFQPGAFSTLRPSICVSYHYFPISTYITTPIVLERVTIKPLSPNSLSDVPEKYIPPLQKKLID